VATPEPARKDTAPWVQLSFTLNVSGSQEQVADVAKRLGTALRGLGNIKIEEAE
jgi:hypothetical protein